MGAVTLSLFCFHAYKNRQLGGLSEDERESLVEVVEVGFPHISTRRYIIISKVNIYY